MKTSEALALAKVIVAEKPTKRVYARNAKGHSVNPSSAEACAFCSVGAVMKVLGEQYSDEVDTATDFLNAAVGKLNITDRLGFQQKSITVVNDFYPERIPEVFDRAIQLAETSEEASQS